MTLFDKTENIQTKVGRLVLEGLVVIASILIAFLLDAWWDGLSLDRQMKQEVQSIRLELEDNRNRVILEINALDRIMIASEEYFNLAREHPGSDQILIPDTLAWLFTSWGPLIAPSFGAIDALIASGRLSQISNAELRQGLAGLKGQMANASDDQLIAQRIQNDQQIPLISDRVDLQVILALDDIFFATEPAINKPIAYYTDVVYPSTLKVRNIIKNRMAWLNSAEEEYKQLLEHIEHLITLLPD